MSQESKPRTCPLCDTRLGKDGSCPNGCDYQGFTIDPDMVEYLVGHNGDSNTGCYLTKKLPPAE